ncbi:MAG: NAD(P)-binding protein [Flammeovirgaceae bacterium]|nr:NAD(P)-binding protein [Flammeovirgaceae bacterium]
MFSTTAFLRRKPIFELKKITVIGGGLSGLVAAIRLVRAQIPVRLFEKKIIRFIASAESISPMKPYLT